MLRIVIPALAYLIVLLPVGWVLWHLSSGYPLVVRLVVLGVFLLGLVDGRRRRLKSNSQTFPDSL
jgi:Flp pilus assembly protein TadB